MHGSVPPSNRHAPGRRLRTAAIGSAWIGAALAATLAASPFTAQADGGEIDWDRHSLIIDGERRFIWSGEFHPFRLPSPDLWRDIFQKMKANGYNTVALYFDWGYHSPKPGVYDFSGIRDMDRVLELVQEAGLFAIVRPGPYMNAEVTRGGFPGWLVRQQGFARTDAPDYLAAADEWLQQIDTILARHQYSRGGPVILFQIENELMATGPAQQRYMQHLYEVTRANGIDVPTFHNDPGRHGRWVPENSGVPGTVPGPVDLYAFDGYPGGSCQEDATPGPPNAAPDWGIYSQGGADGGASASPNTPGFTAEFGGGWFDYWGSEGTYPCTAIRQGSGYERVFYGTNIANALTIQSFYMTMGGTSWGWLSAPVVYSSYDYGSAISETREQRDKLRTMKQLGQFLARLGPQIAHVEKGDDVADDNDAIKVYHNVNPEHGTHFYVAMHDPSDLTTQESFHFTVETDSGRYRVPQSGTLRIDGQDAKILLAHYAFEGQQLVYSTSELQTHLPLNEGSLALFYGRRDEDGETVLRYPEAPTVEILDGELASHYDAASGDLRLNYRHDGLARVRLSGGGRPPLLLLLADVPTAQTFWRQDTPEGALLERGPNLVRTASLDRNRLQLQGDTATAAPLEVWSAAPLKTVRWNGKTLAMKPTASGSLLAQRPLPGAAGIRLPDLEQATWRWHAGSPEAAPAFDDSTWVDADERQSASPNQPPRGRPTLTMSDYGFHHGDVWYRGRFDGAGVGNLRLEFGGGGAGLIQVWLDGEYLGQHAIPAGEPRPQTMATAQFAVPKALREAGDHTIAVMVRNNGHNWDLHVDDAHKEGRGLIRADLLSEDYSTLSIPVTWKLQGHLGGEDLVDPVRGPMNAGGLHGERAGWHLPGFPDSKWDSRKLPERTARAGTSWYRTEFELDLPKDHDVTVGLSIGDPSVPRTDAEYRVLIFVNGWNMGQFIADVGPQRTFVLPNGILDPQGRNTLALAVTSQGGEGDALESVRLVEMRKVRGGVPVHTVAAPDYRELRSRLEPTQASKH